MSSSRCSAVLQQGERHIGYALVQAESSPADKTAIVYFYPLSGCSAVVNAMAPALHDYQCSFLCVDRPDCGATSPLPKDDESLDFSVHRIQGHVGDVLAVLKHEGIQRVYCLGVCLGHPYAVELCRQLLHNDIQLLGLTLVAPFVSTAAPDSWWVARMGASVPSFVLKGFTETAASLSPCVVRTFLRPSALQKLVTPAEQQAFGWTEQDFAEACELAVSASDQTQNAKGMEARLGTSPKWQAAVCDKFAEETGLRKENNDEESSKQTPGSPIPIRIYASQHDKLASLASVKWIAERCYGGQNLVTDVSEIQSHEVMTFFGGPPRNPVLLHHVAHEWGLRRNGVDTTKLFPQ